MSFTTANHLATRYVWSALRCALIVSCGASCASEETAHLIVEARTDLRAGPDFVEVRTRVSRSIEGDLEREALSPAPLARDLSTGFRVAEWSALTAGPKRVEVALLDGLGEVVATGTTRIDARGTVGVLVRVTRTCAGVLCPGMEDAPDQIACLGGRCVSEECAGGEADACETASLPLSELIRRSGAATCEMVSRCAGPAERFIFRGDDCATVTSRANEELLLPSILTSLGEGRIDYYRERAFGCLNALASDCRSFVVVKQHLECVEAIAGTIAVGELCENDFECEGVGTYCDFATTCGGRCAARREDGELCESSDQCRPGVICGAGGTCDIPSEDGEPCPGIDAACQFNSICVDFGGTGPICRPVSEVFSGQADEPCGEAPGVLCGTGLGCDLAAERCAPNLSADDACGPSVPDRCPIDQFCDYGATGVCTALPAPGEPCVVVDEAPRCAAGAACDDASGNCVQNRAPGEVCTVDVQCSSGACFADRCLATCVE